MRNLFRRKDKAADDPKKVKGFSPGVKPLYLPESPDVDIVFVHGLTGDRESTWTADSSKSPWPGQLLPKTLGNARILTFGYDAYVADWKSLVSKNRIGNHARNFLVALANFRDRKGGSDIPIVFVCHSLGGLVCEDMLLSSRNSAEEHHRAILQNTRGILFLGTPHHGSGLARWAEKLARFIGLAKQTNPEIVRVLKRDSETLARIQTDFHTMLRSQSLGQGVHTLTIICFYEEMPLPGIGEVVPMDSAILPAYPSIGIHSDHIGMTKFGSEEDPGFEDFQTELLRIVEKARDEKGTPDNGNDLDPTVLKDIPNAAEPPVSKTGDGNRGTVHLGNNHQSNALYGGTQTFHGDVRFGGSN